ncbi:hypothetical protein QO010_003439 [Caulobacter ginsengisoli]|uniref:Uncharacterized protein n=1 Tax=Caulobacter ginsengisoli TaxID=400775 RepID=A0ABU0IUG0_9CAUL|nr:hypothetical protein [Caulobacter ginsengisoli]MDQ0465650.1 hypothetical protein [Caulobacter ginsengisoli]
MKLPINPGPGALHFLREVAIVILGVLIALVAGEVANDFRERERANEIKVSMDKELESYVDVLALRVRANGCIVAKLDAIDAVLARSGAKGPWKDVGRAPYFFTGHGAWNSEASDLLSKHLGADKLLIYSLLYNSMIQFDGLAQREQDQWTVLQSLRRQDEPITGERRWRLVEASASARNTGRLLEAIAEGNLEFAKTLGVKPANELSKLDLKSRPICQPLEKAG